MQSLVSYPSSIYLETELVNLIGPGNKLQRGLKAPALLCVDAPLKPEAGFLLPQHLQLGVQLAKELLLEARQGEAARAQTGAPVHRGEAATAPTVTACNIELKYYVDLYMCNTMTFGGV